ncbi:hypothetical protein ABB37_03555 [Leptomonas pyrrhocoris]|uniref:Protein-serine/threonine kinase n=1 Tax=Leptomonas pyrrhocoris TaxID=157538 RepID=A0A0M9G568_LEPPY|nr:hypothetical protein ABB37_03555 [Leptomonas pyrrhocoris]KPA82503.1 hypothetical protein ABB37_03555 [Leptomonas pyrrhocoris]|eukprot:XP_015660942.1 hypothetical protein ABB37_03555 [Leptomonas pyrrhocoris]
MQSFTTSARRKPVCNVSTLQHYLSLPQTPMELSAMCRMDAAKLQGSVVHQLVREMAIRTSRCYQTFAEPVILKTLDKPHAERLRWVKSFVLREFNYCVALHRSMERSRPDGGLAHSTNVSLVRDEFKGPPASISRLRNTDDDSFIFESAFPPPDGEPHVLGNGKSVNAALPGPSAPAKVAEGGFRSHGRPMGNELTREEVEAVLDTWNGDNATIPLTTALKLLQPQQSLLDVMVNEAAVRSDELNRWFLRFCRRRVAWRVIHEHLLHLTLPGESPRVICHDTDIEAILQQAGNAVVDIFSNLVENGSVHSLELHVEEDARILAGVPAGTLISSSTSLRSCPFDARDKQQVEPVPSTEIYSIEGHLLYIFREVLKNACTATLRLQPVITVFVKYAMDDKWVVLDFIDHAGGIQPQHFKNIWKFGWTTSEHYESHLGGFGVGLPTSKVYTDMCGGSIDLYRTGRQSTTVRVRFPKAPVETLVPDSMLPPVSR